MKRWTPRRRHLLRDHRWLRRRRRPDSFLTEKPAAAALCRELGIADQLLPSNDRERKTYILVKNRLIPLPTA